ncbi:DUF503 domain-containing protein [Vulgatibacter sp.]|uniref:DUF503 domain-containing protein n=1 Tax=Vulgatibacter sp. TaxID=1971226 RepID=UPI003567DB27
MVVGTLRFVLQIPGSASLKAKRHVMRKVIDRVRARFNVAIAEVGDNDLWQKATIGVAAVGNDRAFVNEVLDKVLRSVEEGGAEAFVVSHELEILTLSEMYGGGRSHSERTLAEAEGLAPPFGFEDGDEGAGDEDYPSLEELEEAAASYQAPGPKGRRR